MNDTVAQRADRRGQLLAQAAAQRTALAYTLEPWRVRLARVDRGVAAVRYVRRHPVLLVGASLLLAAMRPRRIGRWLQRGLVVWQLGRRLLRR